VRGLRPHVLERAHLDAATGRVETRELGLMPGEPRLELVGARRRRVDARRVDERPAHLPAGDDEGVRVRGEVGTDVGLRGRLHPLAAPARAHVGGDARQRRDAGRPRLVDAQERGAVGGVERSPEDVRRSRRDEALRERGVCAEEAGRHAGPPHLRARGDARRAQHGIEGRAGLDAGEQGVGGARGHDVIGAHEERGRVAHLGRRGERGLVARVEGAQLVVRRVVIGVVVHVGDERVVHARLGGLEASAGVDLRG
jgi:hypothetical protein